MAQNRSDAQLISNKVADLITGCAKKLNLAPHQVEWNDFVPYFTEFLTKRDGNAKAYNHMARSIKALGGFTKIRNSRFKTPISKESLVVSKNVKGNQREADIDIKEAIFNTKFADICKNLFVKPIVPATKVPTKKVIASRALHLLLSDLHIGARLDSREGNTQFGAQETARRLASIALQVAQYKPQYHSQTKLYININGDIIQGKLHDPLDGERMASQVAEAMWLLTQFVSFLANLSKCTEYDDFAEIEINCSTGNHDRNTARSKERQILEKWDSEATKIYYALKLACAPLKNVKINLGRLPWISYKCFGANYFATHGDTHFKIPYVGNSVNIASIENAINRLNAPLHDKDRYNVVMAGHAHWKLSCRLTNGVEFIINPALIPVDSYGKSIGIWESPTGQFLFESAPKFPFGDSRFLQVNQETDKDGSLDVVIKKFEDF